MDHKKEKKISIIIPVYNSEEFLKKCLNSLTKQSYKNLEIVVVNDGSPKNCKEIVQEYQEEDKRVKYVEHEKNKGLFIARVTGFENSTGDYIAFLDADDYVSSDFYRELINKAEETNSDIVFSKMVMDYGHGDRREYNLFKFPFEELNGEECYEEFYDQEGLNFSWHITPNKIYSRRVWEKAVVQYKKQTKHLIMTEDFAFSNIVFFYAKKVTKVDNVAFFYTKHDGASTSINDITFKKASKNLEDLTTAFTFVETFLKEQNVWEKYKNKFEKWRALYCQMHENYILNLKFSKKEKEILKKKFDEFCPKKMKISNVNFFTSVETAWNDGLEEIIKKIMDPNTKIVSFDIFDTLITRPFLYPKDLFICLNEDYRNLTQNNGIDFSVMREDCEVEARTIAHEKGKEEITLDEIYEIIQEEYHISSDIIEKIKEKEIELEKKYCKQRKTAYQLYTLAKYMEKRVICTSDMYLPNDVIKFLLKNNGYMDIDKLYLSCDLDKTKATKNLYKYVIEQEKVEPKEIVHIGDNYKSDYENSKKEGITGCYFPKTTNMMMDPNESNNLTRMFSTSMPFWRDNQASMGFVGIRTMIALAANKYFDNPFVSFNKKSDFNADPYLIGYYILGMYMFGVGNWLLKEVQNKGYDTLGFMARDGYLPMEVYNMLKKYYENVPEAKYVRVSRKALIPVMIINSIDLYKLIDVINIEKHSAEYILKYIKDSLKDISEEEIEKLMSKNGINIKENIKTKSKYNKIIKIIIDELFDEKKNDAKNEKLRNYFSNIYSGKTATFDIGYSGRPEVYLSTLCQKPIDTYFLNINKDETFKYSDSAGYKLKTFFDGKPAVTGFAYESIISELAPSCVGYDLKNKNGVEPIFEKYNKNYQEEYIIRIMQREAKEFISDILTTFGGQFKKLYYQNYYISLPMMAYINSSKPIDISIFNAIGFEDTVRYNKIVTITDDWKREREFRNQRDMDALIYGGDYIGTGYLEYNRNPDLEHHSKPIRFIYYMLYDRKTFKRRMKEVGKNHKIFYAIGKGCYSIARGTKRIIYGGMHKIKGGHKNEK